MWIKWYYIIYILFQHFAFGVYEIKGSVCSRIFLKQKYKINYLMRWITFFITLCRHDLKNLLGIAFFDNFHAILGFSDFIFECIFCSLWINETVKTNLPCLGNDKKYHCEFLDYLFLIWCWMACHTRMQIDSGIIGVYPDIST